MGAQRRSMEAITAARKKADEEKGIFAALMSASTQLQTLFDKTIPQLTLKQFMLLTIVRQSPQELTLHELGDRLGCSRQNVRQLAETLCAKGLVTLEPSSRIPRALCVRITENVDESFDAKLRSYLVDLDYLFEGYTDEEISTLFQLLNRLFDGIANVEKKAPELQYLRHGAGVDNTDA